MTRRLAVRPDREVANVGGASRPARRAEAGRPSRAGARDRAGCWGVDEWMWIGLGAIACAVFCLLFGLLFGLIGETVLAMLRDVVAR